MGSEINYDFRELEELSDRAQKAGTIAKISLNEGLRAVGRLIVPAKGTGPLAMETPKITGKLRRSTFFTIVGVAMKQVLMVLQPARTPEGKFYGEWVREGTPPHVITPKGAKALRFVIGGKVIFAMKVNHPGSRANPYHKRTMARLQPRIQEIVHKMGVKVTAYLSGEGGL